jgi:hypothetical protein
MDFPPRRLSGTPSPDTRVGACPTCEQCRVAGVDEIDDSDTRLGGVLPVQATGVLLKGTFPGNGHRQDEGIERRMIKTLTHQLSGRQQDARGVRWQGI